MNVKKLIIAGILLLLCFVVPLNVYTISGNQGIGIQGSFYRYHVTILGPMILTLMQDISYVTSGVYSGRTALSIALWVAGSISLVFTTLLYLIRLDNITNYFQKQSGFLLIGSGILFIGSCIVQFGPLLHGSAGLSLPFGGFLLILLGIGLIMYPSVV